MGDEVLFTNDKGKEVYLPKATGEKFGYKVSKAYVPEELKEPTGDDFGNTDPAKTAQQEQEHAMTVLYGVATNGADNLPDEVADGLHRLTERLLENGFGPQPVEGSNEQTGEPSLVDAINLIERHIDESAKITDNNKEVTKKQLAKLLEPNE